MVPFKLYPFQKDIIKGFVSHRKNIIVKGRQLGVSTVTAAYIAWLVLFHRDKNVLIVATKQETAKNMIRIIKNIFKYIPGWIKDLAGEMNVDNRNSIEFKNGSRVKAITTSADAGRSEAVSLLVVDEAAHIESFDEIWTGISPTISTGGSVILMSSPKGTGNKFYELFEGAKASPNNGFNCNFGTYVNPNDPEEIYTDRFMWWVHPEHDEAWFAAETRDKSVRDVAQEFLCAFNSSGDTFVYHEDISKLERAIRTPGEIYAENRDVWIWDRPTTMGTYLIACDVSRGDAADYSAFHVLRIDVHPLEQVCEYKGKIKPDKLGLLLMAVSRIYNNAVVAPESNSGWSGQTILKMEEAQFPFLYYSRKRKDKEKNTGSVDPYYAMTRNDFIPGYTVTSGNRIQMLAKLEQYIRLGDLHLKSERLVSELRTFVVNDSNRPEAVRGKNDDLVMALAGALWVREESFLSTYRSDELAKAMIDGMSTHSTSTQDFAVFNVNNRGNMYDRHIIQEHLQETQEIKLGSGEVESIAWLIDKG